MAVPTVSERKMVARDTVTHFPTPKVSLDAPRAFTRCVVRRGHRLAARVGPVALLP